MEIFYYNRWSGLEVDIDGCFEHLSPLEIKALKLGDKVWLDLEPYHHCGKVYGLSEVALTKAEKRKEGKWFNYQSDKHRGGFLLREHLRIYRLADKQKLESLVKEYGERMTDPYSREEKEAYSAFQGMWRKAGLPE